MILAAKMEDTIGYHRIPQFEVAFFDKAIFEIFSALHGVSKVCRMSDVHEYSKWSLPLCMSFCWQQNHQEPHCDRTPGAMLWIRSFHSFVWGFIWKLRRNPKNPWLVHHRLPFWGQISHVSCHPFRSSPPLFLVPETADPATSEHSVFDACLSAGSSERLGRCWNVVALQVKGTRLPEK